MYVYTYVFIHIFFYVHIHMYIHISIYLSVYLSIYMYICIYIYKYMYIYTRYSNRRYLRTPQCALRQCHERTCNSTYLDFIMTPYARLLIVLEMIKIMARKVPQSRSDTHLTEETATINGTTRHNSRRATRHAHFTEDPCAIFWAARHHENRLIACAGDSGKEVQHSISTQRGSPRGAALGVQLCHTFLCQPALRVYPWEASGFRQHTSELVACGISRV